MPVVLLETTTINHELGRFAQLGDLEKVLESVRTGISTNINWTNPDSKTQFHPGGETCLMKAVLNQAPTKYPIIKWLLNHPRLDINKQDYSGATALIYAVNFGDPETIRLILAHPNIDLSLETWGSQTCGGWSGGWEAGVTARDLAARKSDEIRSLFGLPPLPPPEPVMIEEPQPKKGCLDERMKKILTSVIMVAACAGIALGVKFGFL